MSDIFDFGDPWQHRDPLTPLAAARLNEREQKVADEFNRIGPIVDGAAALTAQVDAVANSVANLGAIQALNIKDRQFGPSGPVLSTQGAIMDGTSHPLSGYFATLGAAQAIYPHAVALTDELDWAAWQAAINAAMGAGAASAIRRSPVQEVKLPAGTLVINQPIDALSNNGITIRGAGAGATKIVISASMTNVFNCNGTNSGTIGGFAFTGTKSTSTGTGTTTLNSTSVTSASGSWSNGDVITGTGISTGTRIVSGAGTATLVISRPATASSTGTVTGYGITCTNVLNVDWVVAQSAASSENDTFYDIDVYQQMNFVNGVAIGTTSGSADVYLHRFIGVRVYGSQDFPVNFTGTTANTSPIITAVSSINGLAVGMAVQGLNLPAATIQSIDSSSQITLTANAFGSGAGAELGAGGWTEGTLWQCAFKIGQGAQGNVISHTFLGCNGGYCKHGVESSATGFYWAGGALQANQADVYCTGAGTDRAIVVDGVRSERSAALVDGTNGGKMDLTISNTQYYSPYLRSSRNAITWAFGGQFRLESSTIVASRTTINARMVLGAPSSDLSAIIDGLSIKAADARPPTWLTVSGTRLTYRASMILPVDTAGQTTGAPVIGPITNRDYQALATDADFTLTPTTSAKHTKHTGTLTADRAVTLTTTGAAIGDTWRITRTGGGAFNLNVGTGPLKPLVTNTWGTFEFDGTAWFLAEYGAL